MHVCTPWILHNFDGIASFCDPGHLHIVSTVSPILISIVALSTCSALPSLTSRVYSQRALSVQHMGTWRLFAASVRVAHLLMTPRYRVALSIQPCILSTYIILCWFSRSVFLRRSIYLETGWGHKWFHHMFYSPLGFLLHANLKFLGQLFSGCGRQSLRTFPILLSPIYSTHGSTPSETCH